jgi:hypothetical protein
MNKLVLALSVALAFVLGFALNGVLQNCKSWSSCDRGGHASCGKHWEKSGMGCGRHGEMSCCAKHAAGDEQECCKKHAAGDIQECCAKNEAAKVGSAAAANEIAVSGGEKKGCCPKDAHEKK